MGKIFLIIRKEFRHIGRDPRYIAIIFIMPVSMVLLYGYAVTLDIKRIRIAICDRSNSATSRRIVREIEGSRFFSVSRFFTREADVEKLFRARQAKAALVIPTSLEEDIRSAESGKVQVILDGSDPNASLIISSYISRAVAGLNAQLVSDSPYLGHSRSFSSGMGKYGRREVVPHIKVFFNRNLKSNLFFVPGIVAVIIMMISALLNSIAIAREREMGTLENLLVSPLKPFQLVVGKIVPYIVVAFLETVFITNFARYFFHIPMEGSLALLYLMALVYVFAALGIGLLISTVAATQRVAMMLALVLTVMPSVMLSGYIFPIRSMPAALQWLSMIIPAKYFLIIIRGIMLKGNGLDAVWSHALVLVVFGTLLTTLSVYRFRRIIAVYRA